MREVGGRLFSKKTGHQTDPNRPWSYLRQEFSDQCIRGSMKMKHLIISEPVSDYLVL